MVKIYLECFRMNKRFVALFVLAGMFISAPVFADSYIDKQIKASKQAQKYNSVKKHSANYEADFMDKKSGIQLKDPKLIKFKGEDVKKISNKQFSKKNNEDEIFYTQHVIPMLKKNTFKTRETVSVDFYNLYRVTERILRANKLDYINWRILLIDATEDFNAYSTEANLICIYTALYDSLYNNPDALAFVIGHEIAHQVLGHSQIKKEMSKKTNITENVLAVTTLGYGYFIYSPIRSRYVAKESRNMEFAADTLGAEFALRAGYSYSNVMDALNFINSLPHVDSLDSTHPIAEKRIENLKSSQKYFLSQWTDEGRYNLFNSKPLDCKRSSDRVSIIISSNDNNKNDFYTLESPEEILKRVGYTDYKNGDIENAIKYFSQWAEISDSYIPHLYLSYCYENMYNSTHKKKFLAKAIEEVKSANTLEQDNKHVKKQFEELKNYISL